MYVVDVVVWMKMKENMEDDVVDEEEGAGLEVGES